MIRWLALLRAPEGSLPVRMDGLSAMVRSIRGAWMARGFPYDSTRSAHPDGERARKRYLGRRSVLLDLCQLVVEKTRNLGCDGFLGASGAQVAGAALSGDFSAGERQRFEDGLRGETGLRIGFSWPALLRRLRIGFSFVDHLVPISCFPP